MSTRAWPIHGGPSPCGSRNIITTVRTADSTAEPLILVRSPKPRHLLQTRLRRSKSAGCITRDVPSTIQVSGSISRGYELGHSNVARWASMSLAKSK